MTIFCRAIVLGVFFGLSSGTAFSQEKLQPNPEMQKTLLSKMEKGDFPEWMFYGRTFTTGYLSPEIKEEILDTIIRLDEKDPKAFIYGVPFTFDRLIPACTKDREAYVLSRLKTDKLSDGLSSTFEVRLNGLVESNADVRDYLISLSNDQAISFEKRFAASVALAAGSKKPDPQLLRRITDTVKFPPLDRIEDYFKEIDKRCAAFHILAISNLEGWITPELEKELIQRPLSWDPDVFVSMQELDWLLAIYSQLGPKMSQHAPALHKIYSHALNTKPEDDPGSTIRHKSLLLGMTLATIDVKNREMILSRLSEKIRSILENVSFRGGFYFFDRMFYFQNPELGKTLYKLTQSSNQEISRGAAQIIALSGAPIPIADVGKLIDGTTDLKLKEWGVLILETAIDPAVVPEANRLLKTEKSPEIQIRLKRLIADRENWWIATPRKTK